MQQFSSGQQSSCILGSSLLTLTLFLESTDHSVGFPIPAW